MTDSAGGAGLVRLIGIGPGGVDQLTVEAVSALRSVSAYLVTEKRDGDPLAAARRAIIERHVPAPPPTIMVADPERDRRPVDYERAVADWHAARVDAWRAAISGVDGDVGVLVWGDPAFYDSTIRVASQLGHRFEVIPGISSVSLLAARFAIVLHEIGQPVHVTTARRLAEAVRQEQRNIVAMLLPSLECLAGLDEWTVWWGANLGTPWERLVHGRVADVRAAMAQQRDEVRAGAGWVMDLCLLRK